ncbi:hypothetical protein FQR65_LT15210 [Abscondita terminalis]|nr:hypothetical protein FQR65_LT15210 [Abscondita terminalis]
MRIQHEFQCAEVVQHRRPYTTGLHHCVQQYNGQYTAGDVPDSQRRKSVWVEATVRADLSTTCSQIPVLGNSPALTKGTTTFKRHYKDGIVLENGTRYSSPEPALYVGAYGVKL